MEASDSKRSGLALVLVLVALVLGAYLRLDGVAQEPLFGDEYHTKDTSSAPYAEIVTSFDRVGSHVVLPLLQRMALDVFGDGVVSMRLPALIPGLLALFLFFPLTRRIVGPLPAALATLALALSPMHVYYSRFGRSYALVVLLALVLGASVMRALAPRSAERRAKAWWSLAAFAAALLPYTHLSSAGLVAGIALCAIALGARTEPAQWKAALATVGLALVALVALFLPVHEAVGEGLSFRENPDRPQGVFGIAVLLCGGNTETFLILPLFAFGVLGLLRWRREAALVALAAVLGPSLLLLAKPPHGMEYAYARYLIGALPFVFLAAAWGLVSLLRRLAGAQGEVVAGLSGALLLGASFVFGPIGPLHRERGAFANTYLAWRRLPAFDVPFPSPSPFYATLRDDPGATCVVEAMPLLSRAVLVYRNYERQHGKRVRVGWTGEVPRSLGSGAYAPLKGLTSEDADYLILHRDLPREVAEYWRFVYDEASSETSRLGDAGLMSRHQTHFVEGQRHASPESTASAAAALRNIYGPAFYKDEHLLVWKFEAERHSEETGEEPR